MTEYYLTFLFVFFAAECALLVVNAFFDGRSAVKRVRETQRWANLTASGVS